jgi:protein ImuA
LEMDLQRKQIVMELQKRILQMQGVGKPESGRRSVGLGPVEKAFPNELFPSAAVHEFVSPGPEEAAATSGFMSCLLNSISSRNGFLLWISSRRMIFPPALRLYGIDPESIVFVDLQNDKDVLWAVEEALRCSALIAVVGEVKELSFARSRRLQLAIEQSKVAGFIHRVQPAAENTTACAARWKISPLPGIAEEGMPGIGFPKWNVELAKVRNGRPGSWQLAWTPEGFRHFSGASDTENNPETAKYA